MGIENRRTKRQFGLRELGVLEGPPLRGADTIVQTVVDLFAVRQAAFLVFDDDTGSLRARISSKISNALEDVPLADSLSAMVRAENRTLAIRSTLQEAPQAPELKYLDAAAFLGAPVHGPDLKAVGVLVATHPIPRDWHVTDGKKLEDLAHLISQEIMLRASFETLRIMSAERYPLNS